MKNKGLIGSIFGIITGVFIFLSLILTTDKNPVFWTGFGFMIISLGFAAVVTLTQSSKKTDALPIQMSLITLSFVYVVIVAAENIILGSVLKVDYKIFLSIHVISLALIVIVTLLTAKTKSSVIKQNTALNSELYQIQALINDMEKIKSRLDNMPTSVRKQAVDMINVLLDECRFANFSKEVNCQHIDEEIKNKIDLLAAETESLIDIQADDLTSFESATNEIRELIKERNRNIKLHNNTI